MNREALIDAIQTKLKLPKRELEYAFGRTLKYIVSKDSSDNSFPPGLKYLYDDTQNLLEITEFEYGEKSLSPGSFYYDWVPYVKERGLYMDASGRFYHASVSGKGTFRHFAARPGDDSVDLEVSYVGTDLMLSDLTQDELEALHASLREALGEGEAQSE